MEFGVNPGKISDHRFPVPEVGDAYEKEFIPIPVDE
jgi:hypothetical protein